MISIVVPVYNEKENVEELHAKILSELKHIGKPFEIIFVDDGSTDNTFEKISKLRPVKAIRLRSNFGQTSAMDAGFKAATGEIIITLDGDLQNDPKDIANLIKKLEQGFDVVSGWRKSRQDSLGRKILSRLANWLTFKISGLYLHDSACAIKAYRAEFLKEIHLYGEMHVFLPALLYSRGARVAEIVVTHHERKAGISKHYFMKAVKNICDLLTIRFLANHMGRPLVFFGGISIFNAILGIISFVAATILKITGIRNYGQTPLPIFMVLFLVLAMILFVMGFIAELIVRVYWEGQEKTPYNIRATLDNKE